MNTKYSICSRMKTEEGCAAVSSSTYFSSLIPLSDSHPTTQGISVTFQGPVYSRDDQDTSSRTDPSTLLCLPTCSSTSIYPPGHPLTLPTHSASIYSSSHLSTPTTHTPSIYPFLLLCLHSPTYWDTQSWRQEVIPGWQSVKSVDLSFRVPRPVKAESI